MKTAVFIGRFQPPHRAHLETITRALERFDRLIVVLGSAFCYPTPKNPFSAKEREAMIRESLGEASGLHFVPIADDYYDDPRWFRTVRAAVEALTGPEAEIYITGYHKDESSYYLHGFGGWPFEPSGVVSQINATDVRNSYFAGSSKWKAMVPGAVRQFMEQFARTPSYGRLQQEWKTIQHYRALDSRYPYPLLHVASDAVVLAQQQVLLVERGGSLGKGAWALPGGYVELRETLLQAALRELREETGLALGAQHLKATQAFDYPGRSLRGRVISLGHFFDLDDTPPPAVEGQDDASRAFWLPLAGLERHQDRFFEDHYQQICWFLGRAPHQPALFQGKEPS
ncbi:bifunctional nicotinamide-nucleotide adenylyltransferase/Nudix hydroxylase [Meiothermus cerbereus]|uniref:bifunctional nicotinamide-nucleotide adenylyltransferase/Nudix hydroxylase n=1 Tax=Meiothermus cerbereus TaxID=65552 RepID=UPI003EEA9B18